MSININKDKCIGCKKCIEVCPGNLIKVSGDNKAYIKNKENCWGCVSCIKECGVNAITFFLGADIGGRGSTMIAETHGDITKWIIDKEEGERIEIEVDRKNSNSY